MNTESLRRSWQSLGRARVVSVPGFLLVSALVILRLILTHLNANSPLVPQAFVSPASPDFVRLTVSAGATILVCGLVMLLAAGTVLRRRPVSPWITAAVYVLLIIAMSSTAAYVNQRLVFDPAEVVARLVLALLWLILISVALDARYEQFDALNKLAARQRSLERLRSAREQTLIELRSWLNQLVNHQLAPDIQTTVADLRQLQVSAKSQSQTQPAQLHALAQRIRKFGDNTVRELSHQLDQPTDDVFDPNKINEQEDVNGTDTDHDRSKHFWELMRAATIARPFNALMVSITMVVTALPTMLAGLGTRGLIGTAVLGVSVYVCFRIADVAVTPRLRGWSIGKRVSVCLAIYAFTALLTCVIGYSLGVELPLRFGVTLMLGLTLVASGWSIAAAVSAQRRRALLDLAATVAAVEWETTRIEDSVLAIRRAVARMLHGDIQSRLAAVAMRLDFANEQTDATNIDGAIDESVAVLDSVLVSLSKAAEAEAKPTDLATALNAIAASWNNAITITFEHNDDAVDQIVRNSLVPAVIEVVREATSNAARHGSAKHVEVNIESELSSIRVTVTDDGLGAAPDPIAGLGLSSIARFGATWELTPIAPIGTRLTVLLPG